MPTQKLETTPRAHARQGEETKLLHETMSHGALPRLCDTEFRHPAHVFRDSVRKTAIGLGQSVKKKVPIGIESQDAFCTNLHNPS